MTGLLALVVGSGTRLHIYKKLDEQIQVDGGFVTDTFTCILSYYRELIYPSNNIQKIYL